MSVSITNDHLIVTKLQIFDLYPDRKFSENRLSSSYGFLECIDCDDELLFPSFVAFGCFILSLWTWREALLKVTLLAWRIHFCLLTRRNDFRGRHWSVCSDDHWHVDTVFTLHRSLDCFGRWISRLHILSLLQTSSEETVWQIHGERLLGVWWTHSVARDKEKIMVEKSCLEKLHLSIRLRNLSVDCLYHFPYGIWRGLFAGSWTESHIELFELDARTWLGLYGFFWVMAMYITGFVAYTFILISRLAVRDVVCFMCMFGDSPFLMYRPSEEQNLVLKNLSPLRRVINGIFGFLIMDFFQTGKDIVLVYEKDVPVLDEVGNTLDQSTLEEGHWNPQESQGFDNFSASIEVTRPTQGRLSVPERPKITPVDASKYLSNVIGSIEALAGLFQPFIVLISFFSVANLVTHVGAIVSLIANFKTSHWWTFVRTCIWLLLSLRLLWSAAGITKGLSHVSQHLNYLWSVGQLHGDKEEWQRFFKLVESFHLGTKTYGFPLTLKQAASIATFINFALIIVLSIMKPSVHLPARGD